MFGDEDDDLEIPVVGTRGSRVDQRASVKEMLSDSPPGSPRRSIQEAQAMISGDWTRKFMTRLACVGVLLVLLGIGINVWNGLKNYALGRMEGGIEESRRGR